MMSDETIDEIIDDTLNDVTDDNDWDSGDDAEEIQECAEPNTALLIKSLNLATLPEEQWGKLKVCTTNKFEDDYWSFHEEGGALFKRARITFTRNFFDGTNLNDEQNHPLRQLVKAISFYCLPSNALIVNARSFTTAAGMGKDVFVIARFLHEKHVLVDVSGTGSCLSPASLSPQDFISKIESIKSPCMRYLFAQQLMHWQALSRAEFLPPKYRLTQEMISREQYKKLFVEKEASKKGWQPIPMDDMAILVPYCVDMVEKYSEDILYLHDAYNSQDFICGDGHVIRGSERVLQAMKNRKSPDLWDVDEYYVEGGCLGTVSTRNELATELRKNPSWPNYLKKLGLKIGGPSGDQLFQAAKEFGFDLDAWHGGEAVYDLRKVKSNYSRLAVDLRTACESLILMVTGMRRSEFCELEAGQARLVPGSKDDYRLKFLVFKTSVASQGDEVDLPIPDIAYKAYMILERLTREARDTTGTTKLNINIFHNNYGTARGIDDIQTQLRIMSESIGLSQRIHPHQFRKTLATFAIYNNPRNVSLIKRLFSHKTMAMTMAYFVTIPGLRDSLKSIKSDSTVGMLTEIVTSAQKGTIGGVAGLRVKKAVQDSKFLARLNDDGEQSIRQYVDSLLESGFRILHRCPLNVICTRMSPSIVDIKSEACDCDVVSCENAIFTENSIPELNNEIAAHQNFLRNPFISQDQRTFSEQTIIHALRRLAEIQGADIVKQQYPDIYTEAA